MGRRSLGFLGEQDEEVNSGKCHRVLVLVDGNSYAARHQAGRRKWPGSCSWVSTWEWSSTTTMMTRRGQLMVPVWTGDRSRLGRPRKRLARRWTAEACHTSVASWSALSWASYTHPKTCPVELYDSRMWRTLRRIVGNGCYRSTGCASGYHHLRCCGCDDGDHRLRPFHCKSAAWTIADRVWGFQRPLWVFRRYDPLV